jgi:hypothetical protein
MSERKIACRYYKKNGGCPLADVIEAGDKYHGGYWCKDYKQQALCVNKANQDGTKKISHQAHHGRNVHQVDMPRSTASGDAIAIAQSAEGVVAHGETVAVQRAILQKHGQSDF